MTFKKIFYASCVLCAFIIIYFREVDKINHKERVVDLAADLENWMGNLPSDLREVPITNLAIPGSHDSFTSNIKSSSLSFPNTSDVFKNLKMLSFNTTIISRWSKTQNYSVIQQLNVGIRYFDMRFCINTMNDVLYFCHGMFSIEVQSVLNDINTFLDNHPKEVVLLDCQHFYDFTNSTYVNVIQRLKEIFGDKLIPYRSNLGSLTLGYLASQKQQVLIIFRNSQFAGHDFLWPKEYMLNPWYDTTNTTYLIECLNKDKKNKPSNVGYVSQLVLTANVKYIIKHISSSIYEEFAVKFEDQRTKWISNQTASITNDGVNIIIVDFVELNINTYSKTVVNLNQKLRLALGKQYRLCYYF